MSFGTSFDLRYCLCKMMKLFYMATNTISMYTLMSFILWKCWWKDLNTLNIPYFSILTSGQMGMCYLFGNKHMFFFQHNNTQWQYLSYNSLKHHLMLSIHTRKGDCQYRWLKPTIMILWSIFMTRVNGRHLLKQQHEEQCHDWLALSFWRGGTMFAEYFGAWRRWQREPFGFHHVL